MDKPDRAETAPAGTLAGMSLEVLRDRYHYDLFQDYLPFMQRHVVDREFGGFMCNTDRDGAIITPEKVAWYEGRGIWVYSFLYNHFGREEKYLEIARKSVEFILKARPGKGVFWPKKFTREGEPLTPPDPELYADIFIAEGLAEFSRTTGETGYWDLAFELVLNAVEVYDREDYFPDIGKTYLGEDARPFPGARIQGVWMVLLRTASQMLAIRDESRIEAIASRALHAIMSCHYNPEFRLNNELLNHDLSRPQSEYAQLVYTGHAIEALWMVLYEAVRRRDKQLFDLAAERFRFHVEVAWDDVYGGVFRNLQNVDRNVWSVDKVLWAQAEVLIGALAMVEHTGDSWARGMFSRMFAYVQEKFPLRRHGLPLWIFAADRKVTFQRHSNRIENYHHPRHLMLNLLAIGRILERGGAVSGVFQPGASA